MVNIIAFVLLLLATTPTATFRFYPSICTEPCRIDGTVNLSQPERTRDICVWVVNVDTQGWSTSSCRSYPNRRDWIIKDIPAGEYAVYPSIRDTEGKWHVGQRSKLLVQEQH